MLREWQLEQEFYSATDNQNTKSLNILSNVIKMYKKVIGGVDLDDQRTAAYNLDRRSSIRFHLHIFFDLMNVACANSFIVSNKMFPNKLNFFGFKTIVSWAN